MHAGITCRDLTWSVFKPLRAWLTDEARMTQVPAEPPRENRVNQSGSVALSTG